MKSLRNRESVSMDPPAVGVSFTWRTRIEARLQQSNRMQAQHDALRQDGIAQANLNLFIFGLLNPQT